MAGHSRIPRLRVHEHSDSEQRLQAQFEKLERQFALLKEQTRQAQKLASLGTAAAMLAHEFNNLMTPVVGYARHALDAADPDLMTKALRMTLKQTEVLSAMSHRILGLAANESQAVERVNLADAVENALACLCRDLSKDGITLSVDVDAALHVSAEPNQLQQVFFNLLINAKQAISHRHGRITVTSERHDDDFINIHVLDNGSGIEPEHLENIFDEFYSTKRDRPDKSGMGLGLTLCRDIIEEHRGKITVTSQVGVGTRFTVLLPSAD